MVDLSIVRLFMHFLQKSNELQRVTHQWRRVTLPDGPVANERQLEVHGNLTGRKQGAKWEAAGFDIPRNL